MAVQDVAEALFDYHLYEFRTDYMRLEAPDDEAEGEMLSQTRRAGSTVIRCSVLIL